MTGDLNKSRTGRRQIIMPYPQFLKHNFDCLEIVYFLSQEQNYYGIWYSDETKDGFLTQNNDMLTFESEKAAFEFIRFHTSYRKPATTTIYDMDKVQRMIDLRQPLDACVILEIWNIAGDLAGSVKTSFLGDLKDDLTDQIYDKLFYGNNLPEINTSGKIYTPQFTEEEWQKLKDILTDAISVIMNAFKGITKV